MSRTIYGLVIFGFLFLPFTALAQQNQNFATYKMGTQELTLSGSGVSDKSFDRTNLSFDLGYGYFFDSNWQGLIRQSLNIVDQPGDNAYNASTRVGIDYNFNIGNLRPFLGATIGYMYGDGVKESFIAGPEVGLKAFLSDSTFLIVAVGYDFIFESTNKAHDTYSDGVFNHRLGLGYRF
ncbi:MAG: hypothetical protein K0A94_04920 [Desulfuromonadales bacterium]|nr:hypothetical protein [Desulfuromonadales bacterium]